MPCTECFAGLDKLNLLMLIWFQAEANLNQKLTLDLKWSKSTQK